MFRPQFQATRQLRTEFLTSFSFLTIVASFKKSDSCADYFDANFEQQDSYTVFWTSFRLLAKDAKFKQNVNCPECLDPNFK